MNVKATHLYCRLSLISHFEVHEFFLSLDTIDFSSYPGIHTPPIPEHLFPYLNQSERNYIPPILESTDTGCRKRATHSQPSISFKKRSGKYEPKLIPGSGKQAIWLGQYPSREIAEDVFRVAAFYYGRQNYLTRDFISWCEAYLPSIPPLLSEENKKLWIRKKAGEFATNKCKFLGASALPTGFRDQDSPGDTRADPIQYSSSATVENQEGRRIESVHVELSMMSDASEGGSIPRDARLSSPCVGYPFGSEEWTSFLQEFELGRIELEHGACHQQDVQNLQQSQESAFLLECGGAIVGFEAEHHVVRASANQPQAPTIAQELEFTDTIQSALQELREQGWNWKLQPRVSTKFSVAFSGQGRPELITACNYSAFQELHKQGWKITLERINTASSQVIVALDSLQSSNLIFF